MSDLIVNALREVARLKAEETNAEEAFENKKKERLAAEAAAIGLMEADGVKSLKVDGLGGFSIATRYYASIPKEKLVEGMAAMKQHFPELVVEYIHPAALSGFVSEFRKEGQPVPASVEPFISVHAQRGVSFRKG